jgi:hypothetical protein
MATISGAGFPACEKDGHQTKFEQISKGDRAMRITITEGLGAKIAASLLGAMVAVSFGQAACAAQPMIQLDAKAGRIVLTNERLELIIETQKGINPCSLRDLRTGRVYADGDYFWPQGAAPALIGKPVISETKEGCSVALKGKLGALEIEQTFSAEANEPGLISETIRISNPGKERMDVPSFACGFGKKIHDGKDWLPGVADSRFCDVPYRRRTETGEFADYTVPELTTQKNWFAHTNQCEKVETPIFGAEGWAWYGGGNALLITKYNPDAMEWSLVETTPRGAVVAQALRFGGAGQWKLGDPEGASQLAPGGSFTFGTTRYQALDGDWRAAYAEFRRFTESKGHVVPKGFNPPVHWNELYDNKLWWAEGPDNVEKRNKMYQLRDMEIEAEKGHEMGCESLYLDPGWDTIFASTIWAEDRLGTQDSFVKWLKEKYSMPLALHTPLAPWTDPAGYPEECRRMDRNGKRLGQVCCASSVYVETKIARLKELCKHGAYFLMYDGSWFAGECWDKSHGHSVPLKHQEHIEATLKIQQGLHEEYPNVLIEQHDPMVGGIIVRYTPTYFMHAKPGAFDEIWGFEYMWHVMDDLKTGRAIALYYYNLAYSIPVYLHIDLRQDNLQTVEFWWFASTCRHLGMGGKHADNAVWEAQKSAMKTYLSLKRFFTRGVFYGVEETVHAHTLPDLRECVINVFNLEDSAKEREVKFRLSDVGLPSGAVAVEGASFVEKNGEITLKASIPAMGHQLVRVKVR